MNRLLAAIAKKDGDAVAALLEHAGCPSSIAVPRLVESEVASA